MKKLKNTNKGITLIALVITIVVMLILVAVTISMAVEGGLFNYAGKATGETENAINEEQQLGSGKINVDGEWYNSLDDYLAGTPIEEEVKLAPGIYQKGTDTLIKSWEDLKTEGSVVVTNGKLVSFSSKIVGDLVISDEVTELSIYYEDIYDDCGSFLYSSNDFISITGLYIPGTIGKVPNSAFRYCSNLKRVVLGDGVREVGAGAFYYCNALGLVVLPSSIVSIGGKAFLSNAYDSYCCLTIDKEEGSIAGSPWGANGTVTWLK